MSSQRPTSPQEIRLCRDGVGYEATIGWRSEGRHWVVFLGSPALESVEAQAYDAFEALCLVRDHVEPGGWRVGVVGAQIDVWPSGMARDQGSGLRAYRLTERGAGDLVDTFQPVDPATVVTVAEQLAEADRLIGGGRP